MTTYHWRIHRKTSDLALAAFLSVIGFAILIALMLYISSFGG